MLLPDGGGLPQLVVPGAPISLCAHYAESGTDIAYAAITPRARYAICLRTRYVMCGTELAYAATPLRDVRYWHGGCCYPPTRALCDVCICCYAICGTDTAYAAMQCAVLTWRMQPAATVLSAWAPWLQVLAR
eukprot:1439123-Rhodomonas_salina.1